MVLTPETLLAKIPEGIRNELLKEFQKLLRNYRERRWEPAELNGGKFSEIIFCIIKGHADSSYPSKLYKPNNMVDACRKFEQLDGTKFPRSIRIQIPRILIALYEIRNNRNVGHVGGDVDPNEMDSTLIVSFVQWIMAELVRIFHNVTIEEAEIAVKNLVEKSTPLVWKVGGRSRVLDPNLSALEKTLVILYSSPQGMSIKNIVESIDYSNASVFRRSVATVAHKKALLDFSVKDDYVEISPLGISYVEKNINLAI